MSGRLWRGVEVRPTSVELVRLRAVVAAYEAERAVEHHEWPRAETPGPTRHHTLAGLVEALEHCAAGETDAYTEGDIEALCHAQAISTAYGCEPRSEYTTDPALTPRAAVALEALVSGRRRHRRAGEYTALAWNGALADLESVGRIARDGDHVEVLCG